VAAALLALGLATLAPNPGRAQVAPVAGSAAGAASAAASGADSVRIRSAIEEHLGRPYVWGSTGLKSFDCSGFVWRVMQENGILIKRTTARKYYMCLPKVTGEDRWNFGNIVFFDHLKHCGIVDSRETFYHAAVTEGTHLSRFDPLWRQKISGVRAMPRMAGPREDDSAVE
jgi:peptidoglycan endopeptidase LytE